MVTMGDRIREERKKLKLNQTDFARLAGCSRNAQAIYERGESLPGSAYLVKLSEMGVDIQYILTGHRVPLAEISMEERALVENYRAMDKAAQLNMQAVSAAFAQANMNKDEILKDGSSE
ncbi:helix-turn-helix transcriptional regulator [Salmonella enterica subsp. enterica serovar Dahomey]|nr:helix-turn-helix transcriptional regulator [Salmonella enterica subsp. enterica serovar Dahomey]